jgi:hypothetical protein
MLFLFRRPLACVEPAAVASAASCRRRRLMLEFQVFIRHTSNRSCQTHVLSLA